MIARALALSERRLREVVDEPHAELRMTRLTDVVTDIADLLAPAPPGIRRGGEGDGLGRAAAARGAHSLVWTDLMELDPDRMRRAYGTDELPGAWPAARKQLIAAVDRVLAQLDA